MIFFSCSLCSSRAALKEKESETRNKYDSEKAALDEHREQLKKIIETCKLFYSEFEDKRREIKAEKAKRIRELTDPDHAWDAVPEVPGAVSPLPVTQDSSSAPQVVATDAADYVEYRALYDYTSENADDLIFKAGDLIIVHPDQQHEPGWLGGELNGKVGWFPEAYAEPASNPVKVEEKVEKPVADDIKENDSGLYVALFAYSSEEPGDLIFDAGEVIEVVKKENEWWTGKIGDRSGVFPYNYVEIAPPETNGAKVAENEKTTVEEKQDIPEAGPPSDVGFSSDSDSDGKSGKKAPELATVIAPYSATSKEQLTLQKGQMILVRKRTETGWWQGEIQASGTGTKGRKRQIGWFPASYVKLMGGLDKPAAASTSEAGATSAEPAKPKFKALFSYAGQHDDELAFNVGDIITLLSKEEEAWWKGELDGKQGVFPSNYVEEITD